MKTISSRQNPLFKRIHDAIRSHRQEIAIEGPKHVAGAIEAGWTPLLIVQRAHETSSEASLIDALAGNVPRAGFDPRLFDALTATTTSQGFLALFARPETTFESLMSRRERIIVALDGVQDPGNVGTIVRLAAAFDAAGVALLPGCADPFSPKAIRASAGCILSVPVAPVSAAQLLGCGLPLFAADASGATTPLPPGNAVLILGSEGNGVSRELFAHATAIAIETSDRVESLNVASSGAILLSRSWGGRR